MKKIIAAASAVMILIAIALAVFLSRPSVAFISSDLPDGLSLPRPSAITLSFRLTGNAASADLVIVMPECAVPESEGFTVLFGRNPEDGETPDLVLIPDDEAIWELALSDGVECILYDESIQHARETADHLLSLDDNAYAVRYSGRVSVANYDQVISGIGDADTILALTPTTSMRILRADGIPSVILDSLHAAALESTPFSASVGVDWDASVESLLSGSRTLSYALFPAKD